MISNMCTSNIEYYGLNILNGEKINEKIYYFYNKLPDFIPNHIQELLKPFDYGKRQSGFSYSISSYIPLCTPSKLKLIVEYLIDEYDLKIDMEKFLYDFSSIANFEKNIHYDPIVSFKFNNETICGASFYISALKDKTLVPSYYEQTNNLLKIELISEVSYVCKNSINNIIADMFLLSWDFDKNTFAQNKVYLKVKNKEKFVMLCEEMFPYLREFIDLEKFRFSELAFAIKKNQLAMLNLYYKPLLV